MGLGQGHWGKFLVRARTEWRFWLVFTFLIYGPWHGAAQMGTRHPIGIPISGLRSLTWPGLMNALWIGAMMICFALPLFHSFKKRLPGVLEILIVLLPAAVFLNTRQWDGVGIVAIENSAFFALLFLIYLRSGDIRFLDKKSGVFLLKAILLSYFLALTLPFLIPVQGHPIWVMIANVARYRGWVGEGTAYASVGQTLVLLGILIFLHAKQNRELNRLSCSLIVFGFIGIALTVHRISLVALFFCFIYLSWIHLKKWKTQARVIILPFLAAFCLAALFSGKFFEKSWTELQRASSYDVEPEMVKIGNVSLPIRSLLDFNAWNPEKIESVYSQAWVQAWAWRFLTHNLDWATNGRIVTAILLFQESGGLTWTGMGSGWSSRYLIAIEHTVNEPQNEYIRLVIDHGLVGLFWFCGLLFTVWRSAKGRPEAVMLVAVVANMVSENILVFPAFGYGMILMVGWIYGRPVFSARAEIQRESIRLDTAKDFEKTGFYPSPVN